MAADRGVFLVQLKALLIKNVRLKVRNRRQLLTEVLYPVVFVTLICAINLTSRPRNYAAEPRHTPIDPTAPAVPPSFPYPDGKQAVNYLVYTTNGRGDALAVNASRAMVQAVAVLNASYFSPYGARVLLKRFDSSNDLTDFYSEKTAQGAANTFWVRAWCGSLPCCVWGRVPRQLRAHKLQRAGCCGGHDHACKISLATARESARMPQRGRARNP